jgi:hypothetical protein
LPVTSNVFQPSLTGGADAFIARLNPAGSAVELLTYLGGSEGDVANAVAVDRNGNAYVAGSTRSTDFPVRDALRDKKGNLNPEVSIGFVCKLNPTGGDLIWSTHLGGATQDHFWSLRDEAHALALDATGAVYVASETFFPDFPVQNAYQADFDTSAGFNQFGPGSDAFVIKFSQPGSTPAFLEITRSGNSVSISWPVSAAGFGLEVCGSLDAPNWKTESSAPETLGDRHVVTLEIGAGPRLFRLKKSRLPSSHHRRSA